VLFIIFCTYAPFCLEFAAVNNNGTIALFAIAMTFSAKLVVSSSACFGIYEKIPFLFSLFR